jgi:hypothetical protein
MTPPQEMMFQTGRVFLHYEVTQILQLKDQVLFLHHVDKHSKIFWSWSQHCRPYQGRQKKVQRCGPKPVTTNSPNVVLLRFYADLPEP